MTDAELDALVGLTRFDLEQAESHMGSASMSQQDYGDWVRYDDASSAITALRAQLAEVRDDYMCASDLCDAAVHEANECGAEREVWKDRADRAEAALAAQIEVDAWQPIETAPTDCTHVIGIDAKGCVARTRFFTPSSTREWLRVGLPGKAIWHPTHWKPLHEPDAQPHDRTALDNYREKVLREAYDSLFKHPGFIHAISGQKFKAVKLEDAAEGILALIEREGM